MHVDYKFNKGSKNGMNANGAWTKLKKFKQGERKQMLYYFALFLIKLGNTFNKNLEESKS